jgi:hypothetical protein
MDNLILKMLHHTEAPASFWNTSRYQKRLEALGMFTVEQHLKNRARPQYWSKNKEVMKLINAIGLCPIMIGEGE